MDNEEEKKKLKYSSKADQDELCNEIMTNKSGELDIEDMRRLEKDEDVRDLMGY